jgi:SAM-dependent methyltransferase
MISRIERSLAALRGRGLVHRLPSALGISALVRLIMTAWRARAWHAANAPLRARGAPDRLPIPPERLMLLVAGTGDAGWFLESGARAAVSIRSALESAGVSLDGLSAILDFGCGCGRVLRHWAGLRAAVYGCDVSTAHLRWCRRNLRFGRFDTNRLDPPLVHGDGAFDLVYALSVFTHLDAARQRAWMDELGRVLRGGGHLLLTTHGRHYLGGLTPEQARRFERGELVVVAPRAAGSNDCGAFHPESYVREELARGWQVAAFVPEGALGNPKQDLWLLRKPT